MLTDTDLDAILQWGGVTTVGSRSERLQRLTNALAQHRAAASPNEHRVVSPAEPQAWLVDQLSTWQFSLRAVCDAPGVPVIIGRKPSGAGASNAICLPSDAKTISRRHAELCFRLSASQPHSPTSSTEGGLFHLRSLQAGKKAVFHNGTKLELGADDGDEWVTLQNGDRIIVGPCLLHFRVFDGVDAATSDTTPPTGEAIEAAIRALTQTERRLLLSRNPSLRQYAADETVLSWLDSSAAAATGAEETWADASANPAGPAQLEDYDDM